MVLFIGSLAILDVERGRPGANIETFGDALWWSASTVTTVGYGDQFPVTTAGRMLAIVVMLCGIALIGVVTATFASWLHDKVQEVEEASQAAPRRDIQELLV
jgi:voltage-gated potassium channel